MLQLSTKSGWRLCNVTQEPRAQEASSALYSNTPQKCDLSINRLSLLPRMAAAGVLSSRPELPSSFVILVISEREQPVFTMKNCSTTIYCHKNEITQAIFVDIERVNERINPIYPTNPIQPNISITSSMLFYDTKMFEFARNVILPIISALSRFFLITKLILPVEPTSEHFPRSAWEHDLSIPAYDPFAACTAERSLQLRLPLNFESCF